MHEEVTILVYRQIPEVSFSGVTNITELIINNNNINNNK